MATIDVSAARPKRLAGRISQREVPPNPENREPSRLLIACWENWAEKPSAAPTITTPEVVSGA